MLTKKKVQNKSVLDQVLFDKTLNNERGSHMIEMKPNFQWYNVIIKLGLFVQQYTTFLDVLYVWYISSHSYIIVLVFI